MPPLSLSSRPAASCSPALAGATTKFDLVMNLKAAKALSLTIPLSLLQRAEVIQ